VRSHLTDLILKYGMSYIDLKTVHWNPKG